MKASLGILSFSLHEVACVCVYRCMIRGFFFFAAVAFAADPVKVTIDVREWGTREPLAGADVKIFSAAGEREETTNFDGRAVFSVERPGQYFVEAKAPGFLSIEGRQEIMLPAESKGMTMRLYLSRAARLTGVLLDPETEKPIPKLRVRLLRETKFRGERMLAPVDTLNAVGEDGEFTLTGYTPGEFIFKIDQPLDAVTIREETGEIDAAFEKLPQRTGIGWSYWPGPRPEEPDQGVKIEFGWQQVIGKVFVPKVPLFGVAVSVEGRFCEPGARADVAVYRRKEYVSERLVKLNVKCGSGFVVENLPYGEYVFESLREGVEIGTMKVRVQRNERVRLIGKPGYHLMPRIRGLERRANPPKLIVGLAYSDGAHAEWKPDSSYWMRAGEPYLFELAGLPEDYFHSLNDFGERRFKAGEVVRLLGVRFPRFESIVAKPTAVIEGSVVDDKDQATSRMVEAVREDQPWWKRRAMAGDDGKFTIKGLPPAKYKLYALDAEEKFVRVDATGGETEKVEVRAGK